MASVMDGFDPANMTNEQHDHMLALSYNGYNTKERDVYEMKGAGDGRAMRKTGVTHDFNIDSYNDYEPWGKIADEIGISSINNKTDVARMYNYVQNYSKDKGAAPTYEEEAEKTKQDSPIQLSNRAAEANAGTSAYEQVLLNRQGSAISGGLKKPEQAFKDVYQSNLTEELKAKAPGALADKKNDIQQQDIQAASSDDYSLNLGQSEMQPGQAGRRGLDFV